MKKIFIVLIAIAINAFSLVIKLNSTKENGSYYAILHIINDKAFKCEKRAIDVNHYEFICKVYGKNSIKISPKNTKFVNIDLKNKKNYIQIIIKPKYQTRFFLTNKPLYEEKILGEKKRITSKHWIFLFYKDSIFLKSDPKDIGINFPVDFLQNPTPSVDALDLSGTPIAYLNDSKDITAYISIKNDYNRQKYAIVTQEAKKAIKDYPNSIFLSDFLLYRIRAIYKLLSNTQNPIDQDLTDEDIVKLGKQWIKSFPSNQNIPEVLYYIATSYQNMGQSSDAKYFFDILITEHPKNRWTKLGIISFADTLYAQNQKRKAIELYKEVLYSTKDINVASIAANKLAKIYLDERNYKKAASYYDKIIEANPQFLLSDHQKAYDMAMNLSANTLQKSAILILEKLLKKLDGEPDLKELVIKSLGDLYAKEKNYKKASYYYKMYISLYKYGNYIDEVKKRLDGIFFDSGETNTTKLLSRYNELIKKYPSGAIYEKATILKAKLLIKEKRYADAMQLLKNAEVGQKNKKVIERLKKDVALKLALDALSKQDCLKLLEYIKKYKLTIDTKEKDLAKCYLQTYKYSNAISLSEKMLKRKTKNITTNLFWMDIEAKSLLKTHQYKKLKILSQDMATLSKAYNEKIYLKKALFYQFYSYYDLKEYDKAQTIAQKIDKEFKDNFKNIEIFKKMIDLAKKRADDLTVISYAKKIISLQEKYKSYILTPWVELSYVVSLKHLNKDKEALQVLKKLSKRVKSRSSKARIFYEIGSISLKINDKNGAKSAFKKCINIKEESSWKALCKDALSLL